MPRTSFFLRSDNNKTNTRSLYCRVTYKSTNTEFSLKEKIDPKSWNQSTQKMKGNSVKAKFVNTLLETTAYNIKSHSLINEYSSAKELIHKFKASKAPQPTLIELIEKYIDKVRTKIKEGTLRNHNIKLQNLTEYQEHKKTTFYPNNFTLPESELFKAWFMERAQTSNVTTACRNVLFYRNCLQHALKMELIEPFPLIHYKGEKDPHKETIYLTIKELERLEEYCPSNKQLRRIKDLFLFQCYTGLSYGDIWNTWEIKQYEDQFIIFGTRNKNGQRFYVPLSQEALQIINKYPEGLPRYHNVVYNRILKELAAFTDIEKRITTHTARKTFATIQDALGWSRESIAKMLGHKSISTTENYYLGENEQRIVEEMKKAS